MPLAASCSSCIFLQATEEKKARVHQQHSDTRTPGHSDTRTLGHLDTRTLGHWTLDTRTLDTRLAAPRTAATSATSATASHLPLRPICHRIVAPSKYVRNLGDMCDMAETKHTKSAESAESAESAAHAPLGNAVHRARVALELVHDPLVAAIKCARPVGAVARAELERQCEAVWQHVRRLIRRHYDVDVTRPFWAVHRPDDPLNCLALTHDAQAAQNVVEWWAGPAVTVTRVDQEDDAERYLAMAVAMHWRAPIWLAKNSGTTGE